MDLTRDMSPTPSNSKIERLPQYCAVILGVGAAIIVSILGTMSILHSSSSTAAIGFIVLPIIAAIVLFIFALIGCCIGIIAQGILDRNYRRQLQFYLAILIMIPTFIYSASVCSELYSTSLEVNRIGLMNSKELDEAFKSRPHDTRHGYDIYIVAAIAQNPATSSSTLNEIAHLNDPRMNERLGTMLVDLTKSNRKGFAAIRLVAQNPNVSVETLNDLTDSNNFYVLGDIASNRKLSVEMLRKLYGRSQNNNEGYLIEWGLAYNPNTPEDILRELAKKIKPNALFDPIESALKNNPSTPDDVRKILR